MYTDLINKFYTNNDIYMVSNLKPYVKTLNITMDSLLYNFEHMQYLANPNIASKLQRTYTWRCNPETSHAHTESALTREMMEYIEQYAHLYEKLNKNINYERQTELIRQSHSTDEYIEMRNQMQSTDDDVERARIKNEMFKFEQDVVTEQLATEGYDYCDLYHTFWIPKSKGGWRQIDAPNDELMLALRAMKNMLEHAMHGLFYHTSAFAYIPKRRHVDAVKRHQANHSKWFLKLDFSNFFGNTTLDFVVQQLKKIVPFAGIDECLLKSVLKLAFLDGHLPQGTPVSPTITNIMMIPFDFVVSNVLAQHADDVTTFDNENGRKHSMVYTRYADDIIISSFQGFTYNKVVTFINETLESMNAPFSIKSSKTTYGSNAGQNFILGCMLNKDNRITVGHRDKALMKAMLSNFALDYKNNKLKDNWTLGDVRVVMGKYTYLCSVEPKRGKEIAEKLNEKYQMNIIESMQNVIKAGVVG